MGRPASTDKTVTLSVRLPEVDVLAVDALAGRVGKSRSEWLREWIVYGTTVGGVREQFVPPSLSGVFEPMEPIPVPSVASGSVETLEGEPAAPVSPLTPPTGEGVFIANPVTEERTRPEPPPYQPNYDLIGYADRRQKPPREHDPAPKRLPVPDKLPCRHPRWRRLGGVCLSCGEKVR